MQVQPLNTAAFVFARGGSKGLPRKNILPIAGMPLIAHSIRLAQSIERIDKIFVSTDCPEIASIAESYGAHIIHRPSELATDSAPEWLAWRHAIGYVQHLHGKFEYFVSLPATAPLRSQEDVERCFHALTLEVDIVLTMTPAHRSPWFNMVQLNPDASIQLVANNLEQITRRQDAPQCFDLTTVAYVCRPEFVLQKHSLWDGVATAVQIPAERAIDIDTPMDFAIARFLMEEWIPS